MKKQTKMKSAVITSIIAMLLSVAMLFGTTFAWFTDSVTNTNNIIKSGNVDVELYHSSYADSVAGSQWGVGFGYSEAKGEKVEKNTKLFLNTDGEQILWEPGATAVENFRIKNTGSLALKYEFSVKPVYQTETEDGKKLSNVLSLYMDEINWQDNGAPIGKTIVAGETFGEGYTIKGELLANESYDFWVGLEWEQSANDNDYNVTGGLALLLGIELVATQTTFEKDGYNGDSYDKDAEYPVVEGVSTFTGEPDYSWIENNTDAEIYLLNSADAVVALRNILEGSAPATLAEGEETFKPSFEDKTIVLNCDVDLYQEDENGEPICFDPIGSYRFDQAFMGTFDGNGHTISNLYQNTWALDNGYYYYDCGLGLFGAVENATIKNVVIDGANISGESALCGTIAAVAHNTTFENITIKNANVADYEYYSGGIVGWASGEINVINCNIDESTTIGAQWGEFNNANGGVIGGASSRAKIFLKDCTIACRIDAFNDVTSAYEWSSYRRSGMIIGDTGAKDDPDGDNVGNAIAPQLTCENVTVIYGEWANYHYCQFNAMRYPWVRVEAGTSTDAYSNPRYGHPTDANDNEVVDENHVHNDGEKHNELIVFDQLYGGATGDRYATYGTATHPGVTVIYNNIVQQ